MKAIFFALCLTGPMGLIPGQQISLISQSPQQRPADAYSTAPSLSADGNVLSFTSVASNLIGADSNTYRDVFVHQQSTGKIELVSAIPSGRAGNGPSHSSQISANGRYVIFVSEADNLVAGDNNQCADIFVRDLRSGRTQRITPNIVTDNANSWEANGPSSQPCISIGGRFIAFTSLASNWVENDHNQCSDVFIHDLWLEKTYCASINANGIPAAGASHSPTLAAARPKLAFVSTAIELGAHPAVPQIFYSDGLGKSPTHISTSAMGFAANAACSQPALSANGDTVAYCSLANNLHAVDQNASSDIYLYHHSSRATQLASKHESGAAFNQPSCQPSLSADGRFLAFATITDGIHPLDLNGAQDIYRLDTATGQLKRISAPGSGMSFSPTISTDGQSVAFASSSADLVVADTNLSRDIFLWQPPVINLAAQLPPNLPPTNPSGRRRPPSLYPKLPNGLEITPGVARVLAKSYGIPSFYPMPIPMTLRATPGGY